MSSAAFLFGGSVGKAVHQPASLTARRLGCHQCAHAPHLARFRGQDFRAPLSTDWIVFSITRFGADTTSEALRPATRDVASVQSKRTR